MTTLTLGHLADTHNITIDPHLDRELDIPVLTGLQRQGDVLIIPLVRDDSQDNPLTGRDWHRVPGASRIVKPATTPVPPTGTPVVRGENGGNTHAIVGAGIFCDLARATSAANLTLATLTVPGGQVAWLAHPEHGFMGIGAGTYEIRRQREQADELRIVAD